MKRTMRLTLIPLTLALLAAQGAQAASVTLRHGFKPGASYQVTQLYHDVGNSISEMNMMGQQQRFETPLNQQYTGSWNIKARSEGGKRILTLDYGKHQGGERWGGSQGQGGEQIYADSSAEVVIDPRDGFVSLTTKPADDPIVDTIYRARLAWLPAFPKGAVKVGEGFTHEYTTRGQMMTVKSEDDYTLDEVRGGLAYFTIETRQTTVLDYSAMQPEGTPPGMGGGMGNMTLVYKGEGTAVFDIKEGIFVEREMQTNYTTQKPTEGMVKMSMRGTVRDRWEMERR